MGKARTPILAFKFRRGDWQLIHRTEGRYLVLGEDPVPAKGIWNRETELRMRALELGSRQALRDVVAEKTN